MRLLFALLFAFGVGLGPADGPVPISFSRLGELNLTVYHPVESQTDSNPFETADGTTYAKDEIHEVRIAAMSEDFLARSGGPVAWGDPIYVVLPGELGGIWYVHDSMAGEYYNRGCDCMVEVVNFVDLLVTGDIEERMYDVPVYLIGASHVAIR